jgi:hypothetical protein
MQSVWNWRVFLKIEFNLTTRTLLFLVWGKDRWIYVIRLDFSLMSSGTKGDKYPRDYQQRTWNTITWMSSSLALDERVSPVWATDKLIVSPSCDRTRIHFWQILVLLGKIPTC